MAARRRRVAAWPPHRGRLTDRLIERGRIDARILAAGVSFIIAAALLASALLTSNVIVALPLLLLGFAMMSAPNTPLAGL